MAWCWPQSTIKYFHLARLTELLQKSRKEDCEEKKEKNWKRSRFIVHWGSNRYGVRKKRGERERKKKKKKRVVRERQRKKKKIYIYIYILGFFIYYYYYYYFTQIIKNLGAFPIWDLKLLFKWLIGLAGHAWWSSPSLGKFNPCKSKPSSPCQSPQPANSFYARCSLYFIWDIDWYYMSICSNAENRPLIKCGSSSHEEPNFIFLYKLYPRLLHNP